MAASHNHSTRKRATRGLLTGVSLLALLAAVPDAIFAQPSKNEPASLEDLFGAEEPTPPKAEPSPTAPQPKPAVKQPAAKDEEGEGEPALDELFKDMPPEEEKAPRATPAAPPPPSKAAPAPVAPKTPAPPAPAPAPATPKPAAPAPQAPEADPVPLGDEDSDLDALFQDLPEETAPAKITPEPAAPAAKPAPEKPAAPGKPAAPEAKPEAAKPAAPAPKAGEKPRLPSELLEESGGDVPEGGPEAAPDASPAWEAGPESPLLDSEFSDGDEEMMRSPQGPASVAPTPLPSVITPPPAVLTPPPAAPMPMAPPPNYYAGSLVVIPFPPFQAKLTPDLEQYLDRVTANLQGAGSIEIVSYANWTSNGSLEASKRLSASRGDAIKRHLVAKGVPAVKIITRNIGLDFKVGVPRDRVEIIAR